MRIRERKTVIIRSNDSLLKEFALNCSENSKIVIEHLFDLPQPTSCEITYIDRDDGYCIDRIILTP
jgi:hypothetical protein